jgi:hypothetical protein
VAKEAFLAAILEVILLHFAAILDVSKYKTASQKTVDAELESVKCRPHNVAKETFSAAEPS